MLSCQFVALLFHKLELDCLFSITTIVNEVQNERLDELASILVNLASVFASFYDAVDLLLLDIQTVFLNGLSEDVLRQIQAYTAAIISSTPHIIQILQNYGSNLCQNLPCIAFLSCLTLARSLTALSYTVVFSLEFELTWRLLALFCTFFKYLSSTTKLFSLVDFFSLTGLDCDLLREPLTLIGSLVES